MDGSVTPRAEMAGRLAKWANAQPELWKSNPVRGDLGIVFVPESERFNFAQQGNTSYYAESARGAYMAFFDAGVQPDWVHIDHIAEYPLAYLPYPVMLTTETVNKLREYVRNGGLLISEGLPGYFDGYARAGETQPNRGLEEVFGAREIDVEFTPDLLDDLRFELAGEALRGRFFKQVYQPAGGRAVGRYPGGGVAAVENAFGRGRALLIGTFPAAAYFRHPEAATRARFRELLAWAGRTPQATVSDAAVIARLHEGAGSDFLWVVNPARAARTVTVTLRKGPWRAARPLWGEGPVTVTGHSLQMTVPERDALVLRLE